MDESRLIDGSARATPDPDQVSEPSASHLALGFLIALSFVILTRWPVARSGPVDSDEFGYLRQVQTYWFPMHHTLFLGLGRLVGILAGDLYRGFILLDMAMSAVALTASWWWLRALVGPWTAAVGTLALGVGPVFWGYGAIAGNYTAIIAVGAILLGIAYRTSARPEPWHPWAAATVLAMGTGYRQDLGTFWLPILLWILWKHRWRAALGSAALFTLLNLAWLLAMLSDVGGWDRYRSASAEFAHSAGYLNSVWNLGLVDGPLRYLVKLAMGLTWTLGPCLLFVPRGAIRVSQLEHGRVLGALLGTSLVPPLLSHLLIHFGVPGYAFHYIPALLALAALGAGDTAAADPRPRCDRRGAWRLGVAAALLAMAFLFYPTNYDRPGWRGSFDLAFARHTRSGLMQPTPNRQPAVWRTINSRVAQRSDEWPTAEAPESTVRIATCNRTSGPANPRKTPANEEAANP